MKTAVSEMYRQVGDLVIADGIAVRGLIVRHLVLPENLAGSSEVLPWIADEISRDTYVNIMDQYHPAYQVSDTPGTFYPGLGRGITPAEYHAAIRCARECGLYRCF